MFAAVGDTLTFTAGRAHGARGARPDRRRGGRRSPTISCSRPAARSPSASRVSSSGASCCPSGCRSPPASAAARPMRRRRCGFWRAPTASRSMIPALLDAARATGADVPVCLDPRPRVMRGIGDVLSAPLDAAAAAGGAGQSGRGGADQGRVRASSRAAPSHAVRASACDAKRSRADRAGYLAYICRAQTNDLEPPAIALQPVDRRRARGAARARRLPARAHVGLGRDLLRPVRFEACGRHGGGGAAQAHAGWWVRATTLGTHDPKWDAGSATKLDSLTWSG